MRRRRRTEEPANQERWLISYADFITLLFAFFVVLFASSYRDKQTIKRISEAIHVGFQEMGAYSGGQNVTGAAYPNVKPDTTTYTPPAIVGTARDVEIASASSAIEILELQRQIEAAVGKEILNHEVVVRVTPEGFVISLRELGFFNSGDARLLPGAAEKIKRIAKILMLHGMDLRVEGHSDDQPIHTDQYRSNWELSTARAMAVLLLLVDDAGFDPRRISVAGYGQYRPVADNARPEGRRMNRRVDLVVVSTKVPPPHLP
jgi:chemotaxis protein MotB